MVWATHPINIRGRKVEIRTLTRDDVPVVAESLVDPDGWFDVQWGMKSAEDFAIMLSGRLDSHDHGLVNPLVYFMNDEVAGVSNLMRFDRQNLTVEIGGTCVAPKWRRSVVNTDVKLHLLKHCFETLKCLRVEFRVDVENFSSQNAVKRIGATLEGKLRHRMILPDGRIRDGFIFSIIAPEWPETKIHIQNLFR